MKHLRKYRTTRNTISRKSSSYVSSLPSCNKRKNELKSFNEKDKKAMI